MGRVVCGTVVLMEFLEELTLILSLLLMTAKQEVELVLTSANKIILRSVLSNESNWVWMTLRIE